MDFALENGSAARASHRIVAKRIGWLVPYTRFQVQERRTFLWVIPYWKTLEDLHDLDAAEAWLFRNWKLPAYFHVTRKTPA